MSRRAASCNRLSAVVLAAVWMAGCGETVKTPAAKPKDLATTVSLRVAGVEEYQQLLDSYRGQVVLVDFWATWCMPCVQQFPHTVDLHREYGPRGLAVMSVSMNEVEEEPQVREFLDQQEAGFTNLLSKYGGGTEAIEAFELPGSVPCYRIYDRDGGLRHEFAVDPLADEQFAPEDVTRAIVELLGAAPRPQP